MSDNIKMYFREDVDRWRAIVSTVNKAVRSIRSWKFLEWLNNCWLLKQDSTPCRSHFKTATCLQTVGIYVCQRHLPSWMYPAYQEVSAPERSCPTCEAAKSGDTTTAAWGNPATVLTDCFSIVDEIQLEVACLCCTDVLYLLLLILWCHILASCKRIFNFWCRSPCFTPGALELVVSCPLFYTRGSWTVSCHVPCFISGALELVVSCHVLASCKRIFNFWCHVPCFIPGALELVVSCPCFM
jgi:hypothetical protein